MNAPLKGWSLSLPEMIERGLMAPNVRMVRHRRRIKEDSLEAQCRRYLDPGDPGLNYFAGYVDGLAEESLQNKRGLRLRRSETVDLRNAIRFVLDNMERAPLGLNSVSGFLDAAIAHRAAALRSARPDQHLKQEQLCRERCRRIVAKALGRQV